MPQANKGIFYGWYIVITSFLIMFSAFSIVNSLHSLFLVPVTEELGMTRTTFSFVLSVGGLGVAIASPFMGKLLAKRNMKLIMAACVILAGCGFMLYSLAQSAVYFAIVHFLSG
ncbi:MFS transporter [Lysinibacillus sp. FW12]|uniref:MFS transporter n=1 Tax=Lysinibacillus sp. FW12 TaxID=3096079 RepID=UPI003D708D6B